MSPGRLLQQHRRFVQKLFIFRWLPRMDVAVLFSDCRTGMVKSGIALNSNFRGKWNAASDQTMERLHLSECLRDHGWGLRVKDQVVSWPESGWPLGSKLGFSPGCVQIMRPVKSGSERWGSTYPEEDPAVPAQLQPRHSLKLQLPVPFITVGWNKSGWS